MNIKLDLVQDQRMNEVQYSCHFVEISIRDGESDYRTGMRGCILFSSVDIEFL